MKEISQKSVLYSIILIFIAAVVVFIRGPRNRDLKRLERRKRLKELKEKANKTQYYIYTIEKTGVEYYKLRVKAQPIPHPKPQWEVWIPESSSVALFLPKDRDLHSILTFFLDGFDALFFTQHHNMTNLMVLSGTILDFDNVEAHKFVRHCFKLFLVSLPKAEQKLRLEILANTNLPRLSFLQIVKPVIKQLRCESEGVFKAMGLCNNIKNSNNIKTRDGTKVDIYCLQQICETAYYNRG